MSHALMLESREKSSANLSLSALYRWLEGHSNDFDLAGTHRCVPRRGKPVMMDIHRGLWIAFARRRHCRQRHPAVLRTYVLFSINVEGLTFPF